MGGPFTQQDGLTAWGDKAIQGTKVVKWEPSIIGHTHRILFLSPPLKKLVHYHDQAGFFECFAGICCDKCDKSAFHRIGLIIFAYETDENGQISYDSEQVPLVKGRVMPMILSENQFIRLSGLDKTTQLETDGRKSLNKVDTLIRVPDENAKKFKKWEISLSEVSLFYKWVAAGKSTQNPDGRQEITDKVKVHGDAMKAAWARLSNDLGRKTNEEQFLSKIGGGSGAIPPMSPDALPDMGDPTAHLTGL